jgi:Ni,Fe-hydrogenase III large subunit
MTKFADLFERGRLVEAQHGWPRVNVDRRMWRAAITGLSAGNWGLLGLWGEPHLVHMAILDEGRSRVGVLSLECRDGRFPSVGLQHAPAIRLERTLFDLLGLIADGAEDRRPWLDHGKWPLSRPLGEPGGPDKHPLPYRFLPAEGEGLHQIPVGPVHAGIIEPGHFRFTANGETVVRLEERLGYAHRGLERMMLGAPLEAAAKLAARACGDSTVAYSLAFARAAEAALGIEAPPRATWLRALMAELERLANHLGDIGAVCNDAAFALMLAHCAVLREQVLRASALAFGHRLMMDRVVPGGVAADLRDDGRAALRALLTDIGEALPALERLYDETASLQDRTVSTGALNPELALKFAAGGFIGRASGRWFDVRSHLAYAPYDKLEFEVPVLQEGDVDARVRIRFSEVKQSLGIIRQILDRLPGGLVLGDTWGRTGEGLALAEGFRGDVLAWVRIGEGEVVERAHLRDPSWFQWPLLEAAIEGNIVADFPLCNKSFNCAYAGVDL